MSKEKKKPKQHKLQEPRPSQSTAAIEAETKPHNVKREALGPNTQRKG